MSPLAPPAYAAFEPHIDRQAADIALTGFFADVERDLARWADDGGPAAASAE